MRNAQVVQAWAKKRGYCVALGRAAIVEEVRRSIEGRRKSGEIDPAFFRENLEAFTYLEGISLRDPRSVIIIAVPKPAVILTFNWDGRKVETILPPTYLRYRPTFAEVRDDLGEAISSTGFRVELLNAPLKAIANRLGLVAYGRTNVGYIEDLGSFFQLVGLVSDMPFEEKDLPSAREETLLPRCLKCRICAAACPTGAIEKGRVLLHGEKCYTLFSESIQPIPEGLKPPSPDCLIGCLRCQQLCPENKGKLRREPAPVSFDEEETRAFLGLKPEAGGPAFDRALAKFKELGLTEGFPVFRRNLSRLLKKRGRSPKYHPSSPGSAA